MEDDQQKTSAPASVNPIPSNSSPKPSTSKDNTVCNEESMSGTSSNSSKSNTNVYRCRRCQSIFLNRRELYQHQMRDHTQTGQGLTQPTPYSSEPWNGDQKLKETYEVNRSLILRPNQIGSVSSTYNIPLAQDFSMQDIMDSAENIYDRQQHAFRLNLEFGLILVNIETGEYRYFRPYSNQSLFPRPMYISRRRDLVKLRKRMESFNVTDYANQRRPNTKWKPVLITNVRFVLFHLHYVLGVSNALPEFITNCRSIVALNKRRKDGKPYDDNFCLFRCLSTHYHGLEHLEKHTKEYFRKWVDYMGKRDELLRVCEENFHGVAMDQMGYFEQCFQINVNVFQLREDGSALSIYKSLCKFPDTMHLNLYEHHVSYISNFQAYATKYQCRICERHFNKVCNMRRHERTCKGTTLLQFPGGYYTAPNTVFDKLEEYGIVVNRNDRLYRWFLVYDFEAILVPLQVETDTKLVWTARHLPISVSICSNVSGFTEPKCIVNPDTDVLVKSMVEYMQTVAKKAEELTKSKFSGVFRDLQCAKENAEDFEEAGDDEQTTGKDFIRRKLVSLEENLEDYCKQLVCLGFNSSKYDMNLIKSCLAKHLQLDEDNMFTVKRNNEYACLSTSTLKFLDVTSYLSPGINYAKFLKAFDVSEEKGFFPYEWFDDIKKLDHPCLPPHESFYSSLKQTNISLEEYDFCQKVWNERQMTTFKDFLIWYNNLDVEPFVTAVENLQRYYFERYIDIFKVSISVSGLARHMLFECGRNHGASFALFNETNKDLYFTIKRNIVGGPSIIFNRYHEVSRTFIRNNPTKPCQKIIGFDANALYLYCIGKTMPTGPFVQRRAEDRFKPVRSEKYIMAYKWMDWLNERWGLNIEHKLNRGKEKKIGPFPVDGYDPSTNTVFQFQGCYWHGHHCRLTQSHRENDSWLTSSAKRAAKTARTTRYLQRKGYTVVEMRECDFRDQMRSNQSLVDFLEKNSNHVLPFLPTESDILQAILEGRLFGMVECDIRVPSQWPSHFKHPTMTPFEYFHEMSPLFCTTDVPYEVIGDHMQEHVDRFDLPKMSRHLLVGGMAARKILLGTPLLRWYLQHGLEMTHIYQVIEFEGKRCFQQFVNEVSNARRMGDVDPSKSIIADTRKLEGNSAFGSTIMDQEKFQNVGYVCGEGPAMFQANLPEFKKLTRLSEEEEYYEIEKAKTTLKINLPVQIGFFILQYAKLHMLQFYYDFLDQFVSREDFEYCEMDTDSAYMALSGPDLLSVIKPEKRTEYVRGLQAHCTDKVIEADACQHWFPRTCCREHQAYDKRTPGLFKIEYDGDVMIGLCSKTYIVGKKRTVTISDTVLLANRLKRKALGLRPKRLQRKSRVFWEKKFSSKGISKKHVSAPLTTFRRVLTDRKTGFGINRGLRARNNTIYTYHQKRCGFSYFYCKRKVMADGRTTAPLDLVLCPHIPDTSIEDTSPDLDEMDRNNVEILLSLQEENL